jgi:hypothetical protein
MMREALRLSLSMWALLCASVSVTAHAQDLVWRCGTTLTNRLPDEVALQRECVPVFLPSVITVVTPRFAPVVPPLGPAAASRPDRTQVDADEQKRRDAQARELLLAERQKALARLLRAEQSGDHASSELARADIASLDRELARRP